MNNKFNISLRLIYTGFCKVDKWWNFCDMTSPLYRIYLITKGECQITIKDQHFHLCEGDIFIIPKLVKASYKCDSPMEHYYICVTDGENGTLPLSEPSLMKNKCKAGKLEYALFKRLVEISPEFALPTTDPNEYDNCKELFVPNTNPCSYKTQIEQKGIILQLFSMFITQDCLTSSLKDKCSHERISNIIHYINDNLENKLSVSSLSEMMFVSPDHFTKLFKSIIGMPPAEYIKLKRIEKACAMLRETAIPITEIAERSGLGDKSQFSRIFLEYMGERPKKYRERSQ